MPLACDDDFTKHHIIGIWKSVSVREVDQEMKNPNLNACFTITLAMLSLCV